MWQNQHLLRIPMLSLHPFAKQPLFVIVSRVKVVVWKPVLNQKNPVKILEYQNKLNNNQIKFANINIKYVEKLIYQKKKVTASQRCCFLWFSIRNWHGTFTSYLHRRLEIVRNSRTVWHPEIPVEFNLTATKKNSAGKKSWVRNERQILDGAVTGSRKVFIRTVVQVGWKNSFRISCQFCRM